MAVGRSHPGLRPWIGSDRPYLPRGACLRHGSVFRQGQSLSSVAAELGRDRSGLLRPPFQVRMKLLTSMTWSLTSRASPPASCGENVRPPLTLTPSSAATSSTPAPAACMRRMVSMRSACRWWADAAAHSSRRSWAARDGPGAARAAGLRSSHNRVTPSSQILETTMIKLTCESCRGQRSSSFRTALLSPIFWVQGPSAPVARPPWVEHLPNHAAAGCLVAQCCVNTQRSQPVDEPCA